MAPDRGGTRIPGRPRDRLRWWDGRQWTRSARPAPPTSRRRTRRARPARPRRLLVAPLGVDRLGVALVAVAGVVLGLVIWHDPAPRRRPGGCARHRPRPAADRRPRRAGPGTRRGHHRWGHHGPARRTRTGSRTDPMTAEGLFDSYFAGRRRRARRLSRSARLVGRWSGWPTSRQRRSRPDPDVDRPPRSPAVSPAGSSTGSRPGVAAVTVAEHSVDGCSGVLAHRRGRLSDRRPVQPVGPADACSWSDSTTVRRWPRSARCRTMPLAAGTQAGCGAWTRCTSAERSGPGERAGSAERPGGLDPLGQLRLRPRRCRSPPPPAPAAAANWLVQRSGPPMPSTRHQGRGRVQQHDVAHRAGAGPPSSSVATAAFTSAVAADQLRRLGPAGCPARAGPARRWSPMPSA